MSRIPVRALFFLLGLFSLLMIGSNHASAQSVGSGDVCVTDDCGVEATSEMATNGTEIDTYSVVENDDFDEGIDAVAVEGDLYDNTSGALLRSGDDEEEEEAEVELSASVNAPHEYELDTYTSVCADDDGEGDCDEEDGPDFGLVIDTDYPEVSSISPTSITVGTSGTITVNGQNFIDQFGDQPSPFINNSGVTLTLGSVSDTQAKVNYSVESNASTGDYGLNLKGLFGNGEPATLAVGDPSPTVTSISPSVWYAGNSYTVTITGTNFGTNPTSSISAAPGVTYSQTAGSDTSITASVTVAVNAPNTNPISVTVTSQGFGGGSGFFSGNGGSSSASNTAQAVAVTPAPQIVFGGKNVSGTTQSVMAGQQIALSVPTPNGYSVQSQSWSFSNQSAITGGFVNGAGTPGTQPSASAGGSEAADPALSQNSLTFYWVNPGDNDETVTYTYTLNNGGSASSTVAFNIGGPTGSLIPTESLQTTESATVIANPTSVGAFMHMQNSPNLPAAGVAFVEPATLPSTGKVIWIQILNSVTYSQLVHWSTAYTPPASASNQVDGVYPYPSGNPPYTTNDSPGRNVNSILGEAAESFDATMYALWDPALPAGCTPANTALPSYQSTASTCTSTPIPLGSIRWRWSACAVNQGTPSQNINQGSPSWVLQCGPGYPYSGQSNGYPEWTRCSESEFGSCQ